MMSDESDKVEWNVLDIMSGTQTMVTQRESKYCLMKKYIQD